MVLGQFLLEDGAADFDFQYPAADGADAGLTGQFRGDGFAPRGFEAGAFGDATPTAGDEETAEDIGQIFRAWVRFGHPQLHFPLGCRNVRAMNVVSTFPSMNACVLKICWCSGIVV